MSRLNQIDTNNQYNHYNRNVHNTHRADRERGPKRARELDMVDVRPTQRARTIAKPAAYGLSPAQIQEMNRGVNADSAVQDALTLFNEGKASINEQLKHIRKRDELVLFLGDTGAGKSTLINHLSGVKLSAKKNGTNWHITATNPVVEIGNSNTMSETTVPRIFKDALNHLIYCDVPGFNDSRGKEHQIANACLIKEIASRVRSIKVMVVVTQNSMTGERANSFQGCIHQLNSLIGDFSERIKGISLIVTKVAETATEKQVHSCLKEIKNELQQNSPNSASFCLLEGLLDRHNGAVALFKEPNSLGKLDTDTNTIIRLIKDRTTSIVDADINIPASPELINQIGNLSNRLNDEISHFAERLGFELREEYLQNNSNLKAFYRGLSRIKTRRDGNFLRALEKRLEKLGMNKSGSDLIGQIKNSIEQLKFLSNVAAKDLSNTGLWLDNVKNVIKDTIIEYRGGTLRVSGKYPLLSEVNKSIASINDNIDLIEVFGSDTVFLDTSIKSEKLQGIDFLIIAPKWQFCDKYLSIDLSGKVGEEYYESADAGSTPGDNGKDGKAGKPGEPGGNFRGVGREFYHGSNKFKTNDLEDVIIINVDGGKGGIGQDGGPGAAGENGENAPKQRNSWVQNLITDRRSRPRGDGIDINHDTSVGEISKYLDFYIKGTGGKKGGDGGRPGAEGRGGLSGCVKIFKVTSHSSSCIVNFTGRRGDDGERGEGGIAGEGGANGQWLNYIITAYYKKEEGTSKWIISDSNIKTDWSDCDYARVPSGRETQNTSRFTPEPPRPARTFYISSAVNEYKNSLPAAERNSLDTFTNLMRNITS